MSESILCPSTRSAIYNSSYWRRSLFGCTLSALIAEASALRAVGSTAGTFGRPTRFLCLLLKLHQLRPSAETLYDFAGHPKLKYLAALALLYIRLTASPREVYLTLEQFLADFRKIRVQNLDASLAVLHMDEFVDRLLTQDTFLGIALPVLPHRALLEKEGLLEKRVSPLSEMLENADF